MAGNQIHYKTQRGKTTEEYEDVLGAIRKGSKRGEGSVK